MTEDNWRAALAGAVLSGNIDFTPEEQADALLPVVRRIVADELRAAAESYWREPATDGLVVDRDDLLDRANALGTPTTGGGE